MIKTNKISVVSVIVAAIALIVIALSASRANEAPAYPVEEQQDTAACVAYSEVCAVNPNTVNPQVALTGLQRAEADDYLGFN